MADSPCGAACFPFARPHPKPHFSSGVVPSFPRHHHSFCLPPLSCALFLRLQPSFGDRPPPALPVSVTTSTVAAGRLNFTRPPSRFLVVHCMGSPTHPTMATGSEPPSGDRAGLPSASPPRRAAPAGGMDDIGNFPLRARGHMKSAEELLEEEVDCFGSPFRATASTDSEEGDHDILWMLEVDTERACQITYAFIAEDGTIHAPAPFIRSTIFSIAPRVHSACPRTSRGQMMLIFNTMTEWDFVVGECPIIHDRASLVLECSKEGTNHFFTEQPWLVAIATTRFPDEHWTMTEILAMFAKLGTVVDIDWACLTGYTPLIRVVVARESPRASRTFNVWGTRGEEQAAGSSGPRSTLRCFGSEPSLTRWMQWGSLGPSSLALLALATGMRGMAWAALLTRLSSTQSTRVTWWASRATSWVGLVHTGAT